MGRAFKIPTHLPFSPPRPAQGGARMRGSLSRLHLTASFGCGSHTQFWYRMRDEPLLWLGQSLQPTPIQLCGLASWPLFGACSMHPGEYFLTFDFTDFLDVTKRSIYSAPFLVPTCELQEEVRRSPSLSKTLTKGVKRECQIIRT